MLCPWWILHVSLDANFHMLSTWVWWEIFLQIFQQLLDEYCFADAKVIHIKMWENLNVCATNTKQFFMDAQITNMYYKDYMHFKRMHKKCHMSFIVI